MKTLEAYCIINWFWFAKTLFKDCLPVYERVNIEEALQIFTWYSLCSFIQWNICYLFISLANNGLLIFSNFIEFCFSKTSDKYSGTESSIHNQGFLQKYLAALTVNHFYEILRHRQLTGSLIRLSQSKLKCCSAKFEDCKIASYSFYSLYYSFFLVHSQRYFKF